MYNLFGYSDKSIKGRVAECDYNSDLQLRVNSSIDKNLIFYEEYIINFIEAGNVFFSTFIITGNNGRVGKLLKK